MLEHALKFYGTDWIAMSMTFASLHFLGSKHYFGFVFGIVANISWMAFGIIAGSIASPIANCAFIYLNIRGILKWRKEHLNS